MGLPIPFLFFWENPETGKLEIVDGSQRLRTIEDFILGDFALGDLQELSLLTGFRFADLPESRQRKIKIGRFEESYSANIRTKNCATIFFDRINTGSKIANPAELRRGSRGGKFLQLVISLTKEPLFVNLAPVSDKQEKEREREELVTRFFAYSDGLETYKDRVSPFLFAYVQKMNTYFTDHPAEAEIYRQRFLNTMNFISSNFPYGFRRTARGRASHGHVSKL